MAHKRTRENRKPPSPLRHTAGGVELRGRKHGTRTLLHATCRVPSGAWGAETSARSARCSPPSRALSPWDTMSSGARLVHEGRTPTLASRSRALAPRPSPRPGPPCPHLATRRSPSRGGGAGPLRLGCGGRPRAHVSAGWGCAARPPLAPGWLSSLPRPDRLAPRPAAAKAERHRGGRGPGERGGGGAGVRPAPSVPVHLLSLTKVRQTKVMGTRP